MCSTRVEYRDGLFSYLSYSEIPSIPTCICCLRHADQALVDRLIALGQSVLDEQGLSWENILRIGVACPGQVNRYDTVWRIL